MARDIFDKFDNFLKILRFHGTQTEYGHRQWDKIKTYNTEHCDLFKKYNNGGTDINQVHYGDVIMGAIASQITNLMTVYSTVYSDADQRKHQISASLAFVRGIHRGPVNYPHKGPVTRKMFPFDDVIMWMTSGSDNGLSPDHHEAKICTNTILLWMCDFGTNFSEIGIEIHQFSFKKMD